MDKFFTITSYEVSNAVAEFQSEIVKDNIEKAHKLLLSIPEKFKVLFITLLDFLIK
jgi:hypothetical protein